MECQTIFVIFATTLCRYLGVEASASLPHVQWQMFGAHLFLFRTCFYVLLLLYYSYIARSGHKPKLRRLLYVLCTYTSSPLRFSGLSVHTVCCLKSKTRAAHRKTLFNAAATLVKTLWSLSRLLIKTHQCIGCNISIYPFHFVIWAASSRNVLYMWSTHHEIDLWSADFLG